MAREYYCSSRVAGDHLRVWHDSGTSVGFQTTDGHTVFLTPVQIQNLVSYMTRGPDVAPPLLWRDVP